MTQTQKDDNTSKGLGVMALAAIVVSSMIGGGIYSLPQNMAAGASVGAVILSWLITGFGVFFAAIALFLIVISLWAIYAFCRHLIALN